MPAEIPGYYFDHGRNRYFRIQPHHAAAEGTGYSQQTVRRAQEDQTRDQSQTEDKQRQLSSTIRRAPVLQRSSIRGHSLQREVMTDRRPLVSMHASLWAEGLEQKKFITPNDYQLLNKDVTHLVQDQATKTVCFVTEDYVNQSSRFPAFVLTPLARDSEQDRMHHYIHPMRYKPQTEQSPTSSFCLSPSRVLISTTFGGTTTQFQVTAPTLVASYLTPPDNYLSGVKKWKESSPASRSRHRKDFDEGPIVSLQFREECTISTAAAGPQADDLVVALAIDDTVLEYKGQGLQLSGIGPLGSGSDTLSVDYQDRNVIMSGYRNSLVRLWDTRSRASTVRLRSPCSVAHVRAMTGHRIAVAGLRNTLCVYDLRFTKEHREGVVTDPFLTFSEHKNLSTLRPQLGFDVHQNLVAAATDDKSFYIFDTVSGQVLPIGGSYEWSGSLEGLARCIKFVDDDGGWGDGLRLLVAHGGRIDEWAW
ncbi:MAG: hypothetical protein Q9167_007858 [Letrouitia subvulpina]